MHYLSSGELPDNRVEAHKIQVQMARFSLVNGQLYKQSLDEQYLKCFTPQQGQYILAELHEGILLTQTKTHIQIYDVITKGLLSNPWKLRHKIC